MKEKIKNLLKILFIALGVVAIFDWVIAPGLTAPNTFVNILSFILAGIVSTVVGVIIWNKVTDNEEKKEDNDGKIH